mmetsp:Transcript_70235/g.195480  ORF Transcript_70235/g.195480 Transcript_70235/m.195480 type:complete len:262 (+) Transcript_70235:567-1352(+)
MATAQISGCCEDLGLAEPHGHEAMNCVCRDVVRSNVAAATNGTENRTCGQAFMVWLHLHLHFLPLWRGLLVVPAPLNNLRFCVDLGARRHSVDIAPRTIGHGEVHGLRCGSQCERRGRGCRPCIACHSCLRLCSWRTSAANVSSRVAGMGGAAKATEGPQSFGGHVCAKQVNGNCVSPSKPFPRELRAGAVKDGGTVAPWRRIRGSATRKILSTCAPCGRIVATDVHDTSLGAGRDTSACCRRAHYMLGIVAHNNRLSRSA